MEVVIKWVPEDIKTLRPEWTNEECEDALADAAKSLVDLSIEYGWQVLEANIGFQAI